MNLLARLEHDRQDTTNSLREQEERTKILTDDLEKKDEERLNVIMEMVQAGKSCLCCDCCY